MTRRPPDSKKHKNLLEYRDSLNILRRIIDSEKCLSGGRKDETYLRSEQTQTSNTGKVASRGRCELGRRLVYVHQFYSLSDDLTDLWSTRMLTQYSHSQEDIQWVMQRRNWPPSLMKIKNRSLNICIRKTSS